MRLVRRLPSAVQVLILGTLVNKLGSFIFPFLSLVLSREFALPPGQVAALMMAYGVGSLVSIVAGGELTDRLGRRRTMLLSLAGSGLLPMPVALGIVLGANVGSGLLAVLSTSRSAVAERRLPIGNLAFKVCGVLLAIPLMETAGQLLADVASRQYQGPACGGAYDSAIAPGIFWTPMVDGMPEAVQQSLSASIPFPSRLGRPEEFAATCAFILQNRYLNGETIRLDGAVRLAPK